MQDSPFKFLDSYKKGEIDLFFGREEEVDIIYTYIHESNVMLINGPSGTGKSSIIQCGLASRFEKTDWLDVHIRRHGDLNKSLRASINDKNKKDFPHDADILESLKSLYLDYFKPIFLIFDQFEEIFILGDQAEQKRFFNDLRAIISEKGIPCKVLLVMREKYIAQLQNYENIIPEIFNKRVRIELMRDENIKEVITKTCAYHNIALEPEEATVNEILNNLKIGENLVELPHLQIYLDRLWKEANFTTDKKVFTIDLVKKVGGIEQVLKAFLDERIHIVKNNLHKQFPKVSKSVVEQLLIQFTTEEGTKRPRKGGDILTENLNKETAYFIINELISQGVMRLEKVDKTDENSLENIYEFTHDSLAKIIHNQLSIEHTQIIRSVKIIKEGASQYKPELFYTRRTFLNKNQIQEVDLMKNKILGYLPKKEQPTDAEWSIVNISKRNILFRRIASFLLPTIIVGLAFFYISKLALETNTKFDLLNDLASSPTQQFVLYQNFVIQSKNRFLPIFNPANFAEYNEIANLPKKENLYDFTIVNNGQFNDILVLKIKKKWAQKDSTFRYIVMVGDTNLNFYESRTGRPKGQIKDISKQKSILIDSFKVNIQVSNMDSTSENGYLISQKQNIFPVFFESQNEIVQTESFKYNQEGISVEIIEDEETQTETKLSKRHLFNTYSGVIDDSTHLEFKLDKARNYAYSKVLYAENLLFVANQETGICRVFNSNGIESKILPALLPDEKLKFYMKLDQIDYNSLVADPDEDVQNKTWVRLERELKNNSFFDKYFFKKNEKQILTNLIALLENIVKTKEPKECYPLWRQVNNKIAQSKNEEVRNIYTSCRDKIERKLSKLEKQELLDLFYTVRLKSRVGTTTDQIIFFENMSKIIPNDSCVNTYMAVVYSNACWYSLKQKKYKEALEYGIKASTKVNLPKAKLNFVFINLAHAYLANNQIDKAKEVYQKYGKLLNYKPKNCNYIYTKLPNGSSQYNRHIMRDDLKELENAGVFPEKLWGELEGIKEMLK